MHGPQKDAVDLSFATPSVCADRLRHGQVDVGLVPCAELNRQPLTYAREVGIACRGAVRSILLVSKVDPGAIRTLALDTSSRTSVMLARIILERKYGAEPELIELRPRLEEMLAVADAALIIGDPALQIDPANLPYTVLDLGTEWLELTGLPMVFAVWAGRKELLSLDLCGVLRESWEYGRGRIAEVAAESASRHGVSEELAQLYLTEHIRFELNDDAHRGLALYLEWARELDLRDEDRARASTNLTLVSGE